MFPTPAKCTSGDRGASQGGASLAEYPATLSGTTPV